MLKSHTQKSVGYGYFMHFEFYCKETDGGIGFEARGYGLSYIYDGQTLTLDILHRAWNRPLLLIDLGGIFPRNPKLLAEFIEKACQISALLYSSNQTLNLCETMHIEKLGPIVKTMVEIAGLAHDVEMKNYKGFSEKIMKNHALKSFALEELSARDKKSRLFRLSYMTENLDHISLTGTSPGLVIKKIAEKTMSEVIAIELSHHSGQIAPMLMALAARLITVSRLLDKNFDPGDRLLIAKEKMDESRTNKGF